MIRKSIPAALAALTLALTASSALAATGYATGDVNVRAGAGTDYSIVGHLEAGDEVEIFGCDGGWCATDEGYVAAAYLQVGSHAGHDDDDRYDFNDDLEHEGEVDDDPLGLDDNVPESIFSGFDH